MNTDRFVVEERAISWHNLHVRLAKAAQIRSVVTCLSVVPAILLAAALDPGNGRLGAALFFSVPLLVSWILTRAVCQPMVTCPSCHGTLWSCGSNSFKPRRMKVRNDVGRCPHCGIQIV